MNKFQQIAYCILCMTICACEDNNRSPQAETTGAPEAASVSTIQSPTTIDLYPSQVGGNSRFFVMVTGVGGTATNLPLALDTGSSGMTLSAQSIFPSSMVNSSGFIFPDGQTSLTYNGITVFQNTNNSVAEKLYSGSTEQGNLGYVSISFGTGSKQLTTHVMPVFFYYNIIYPESPAPVDPQQGWFGINNNANLIHVSNTITPMPTAPACSVGVQSSCYVSSPLEFLGYSGQTRAGFMLSPAALQNCKIADNECAPEPMLTIGLNDTMESPFHSLGLDCTNIPANAPRTINGYDNCLDSIQASTIAATGAFFATQTSSIIFDTGTPYMIVNTLASNAFEAYDKQLLPDGTSVLVQTPSGFSYNYTSSAKNPNLETHVFINNAQENSIIGIDYFTTNSFFLDYESTTEGWM